MRLSGSTDLRSGGQAVGVRFEQEQQTVVTVGDVHPFKRSGEDETARLREENERLRKQLEAIEDILRQGKPK